MNPDVAHRLVEEALVRALVLPPGAVEEPVAERAVVDAAVAAAEVGRRAREALHAVVGAGALCNYEAKKEFDDRVRRALENHDTRCGRFFISTLYSHAGTNFLGNSRPLTHAIPYTRARSYAEGILKRRRGESRGRSRYSFLGERKYIRGKPKSGQSVSETFPRSNFRTFPRILLGN